MDRKEMLQLSYFMILMGILTYFLTLLTMELTDVSSRYGFFDEVRFFVLSLADSISVIVFLIGLVLLVKTLFLDKRKESH